MSFASLSAMAHPLYPKSDPLSVQLMKNSSLQARKGWVWSCACGLIFSYFKKIEGDYDDQCI
ncbi:hypothetical protein BZJ18_00505 [Salinivibrio sp. IB872]|nr:hypothetical protein BZJ18_00505 [Salinivibrio sp. IB872]